MYDIDNVYYEEIDLKSLYQDDRPWIEDIYDDSYDYEDQDENDFAMECG